MSIPLLIVTAGASVGAGAVAAPLLASVLSKPLTGEVVPTRITDLAGYLTASGAQARGFSGDSSSFEDPDADDGQGQSIGHVSPTVPAPKPGVAGPSPSQVAASVATPDKKRMLAGVSFAGGLVVAVMTFVLIRRVTA